MSGFTLALRCTARRNSVRHSFPETGSADESWPSEAPTAALPTHKNSENVLVNWGNPQLAAVYLKHFERNHAQATPYAERY